MPDAAEEHEGEGFDEVHRKMVGQIDEAAREAGLYLDAATVSPADETGQRLRVNTSFIIGDVAWSKQVQDPEQAGFDKQFRSIAREVVDDEAEELKKRFMNGEIWGDE